MPGVNGICNTKMSQTAADFERKLRSSVFRRNFHENVARRGLSGCAGPETQAIVQR
jgi:hypothetical protein